MKIVYHDNFLETEFDETNLIYYNRWTSSKMESDDFIHVVTEMAKLVLRDKPKAIIVNAKKFQLIIEPEIHKWYGKMIVPQYIEAGVQCVGLVFNQDFMTQFSIEEIMEEELGSQGQAVRFFESEEQALAWVQSII